MKDEKRRMRGGVLLFFSLHVLSCSEPPENLSADDVFADVDTLEFVFEIGEEYGDSTNTFWSISSADIDAQGRIFVLDDVEASVRVFDLNGTYIQELTRRGSGPGELQRPSCLTIAPDGRIIVSDITKGGFVVFSDSLELVDEVTLWGDNSPYSFLAVTNSKYLVCRYKEESISNGYILKHTANIYNNNFTELFTNVYTDSIYDSNDMSEECLAAGLVFAWFKRINCSCDSYGNVFIAPLDTLEYRVYGWDSLGTQFLSIQMDISPVEKEPDEIRAEEVYMEYCDRRAGGWPPLEMIPYNHRFLTAELGIGPDRNLWVRRGSRTDLFFDIFDLDGNLLRHEMYPLDSWSWKTVLTPYGILAWELDPLDGYQRLYMFQ